jgi:glycosyltransferase involved in cell wall biosynthesis
MNSAEDMGKILLITQEYSEFSAGGAGVYAYELASALNAAGINIHVLAPGRNNSTEIISQNLVIQRVRTLGIPLLHIPSFYFKVLIKSHALIKTNGITSVHSNNNAGTLAFTKLPMIATIHHPIQDELKHLSLLQRLVFLPDVFFEKIVIKRSNTIVAVSNMVGDLLKKNNADKKIVVIPNGVNTKMFKKINTSKKLRYKLGITDDEIIIFFPGGARSKRKGGLDLIKSIALLKSHKFRCIVSGESRELGWEKEFKNAIDKADLNNFFTFLGELNYKELPSYYALSDIVVYPSSFEGFGLPILEALACEKPIICTDTGEAKYIIDNGINGMIVEVHDSSKLAKSLNKLLSSKDMRKNMSKAAKITAEKYSWQKCSTQILRLHSKLTINP